MMKTVCLCCLAALCCSCVRQKPQAKEPTPIDTISINQYQWTFEKIEYPEGEDFFSEKDKERINEMKNMIVEIRNDTIFFNHKHSSHFIRKKVDTYYLFEGRHPEDNLTIKQYYINAFTKLGIDIHDSIPVWECDYQESKDGEDIYFDFLIHYTFQTYLIGDEKWLSCDYQDCAVAWYKAPDTLAGKP